MNNTYFVRARVRGTIDYRKAVILENYFGDHEAGVQFLDDKSKHVYKEIDCHISGIWEEKLIKTKEAII